MGAIRTAAALGLFDGVHTGHRSVIDMAVRAAAGAMQPAVFTFDCKSMSFKQGRGIEYIYTDTYRERLLHSLGIERIFSSDFRELKDMSGEEFVRRVLSERMNAGYVVCGRDFRFGRNASCGAEELRELAAREGITAEIAGDVTMDGENVSSRRIRTLLSEGSIEPANDLLGEPYTVYAEVVHGAALGRTIGFPTANQLFSEGQLIPKAGVYGSAALIDGTWHASMTNIGVKPTVDFTGSPLAETYISDFSGDIYGQVISVRLLRFIRPEQKFSSLDGLRAQIARDISSAIGRT
ncbi:MAG: riboflavin biosynthesis protein RibF [Ruminococcus sp.]|nr:riboflavin biosynthesis protein RibF [Ruminococcus sp.]